MMTPEFIDNVNKTLKSSLKEEIKPGSKISIAAACFSIYAYQELQNELKNIEELRFIFTSPAFITEKAKKEKREFYIPRLNRERSLYGTEFEVKLRNELNQKAIAKECAEWIKKKVCFKSNITQQSIPSFINIDETNYNPVKEFTAVELGVEKGNNAAFAITKIKAPLSMSFLQLSLPYEDDIDCSFVITAYKTILDYFYTLNTNRKTSSMSFSMKEVFNNRLKVIWYELENCDKEKEVTVFSNINMGKIPLTNAELIKAILLKKNEDNQISEQKKNELELKQNQIAVEWEDMESKLSDESFWNFLVNNDIHKYSTRLDFVFNILAHNINVNELIPADTKYASQNEVFSVLESANKEKFSFYVINNYFRLIKLENENGTNKTPIEPISYVWKRVQEYFRMFKEWYSDPHCYHLIGFLVGVSSDNYIHTLSELCEEYMYPKNANNHKTEFEIYLREKIQNDYFLKLKRNTKGPFTEKLCEDIVASLSYKDNSGEELRNFFVLYNISYIEACEKGNRFSFEEYKNEDISWDIEHINAIADQMPNDMINDSVDNDRRVWLENADFIPENLVTKNDKLNVNQLIKQILQDKSYLKKYQTNGRDLFPSIYEAVIDWFGDGDTEDNSIGNLTLLDSRTNRAYKNNIFPIKRKTIIQRMSQDAFIPICTRNVFTKSYPESVNSNNNFLKWTKKDKEEYVTDLVHFISNYLLGVKNGK